MSNLAKIVMQRIEALAKISEEPDRLTRTYGSDAMRGANELVASWMREAGMTVRRDVIGNLIGHYAAENSNAKVFVIGSHLDTVRDAGKFDGPLGVLIGIACVQHLYAKNIRLPFSIQVAGFCDEEGVRFQSTYLGSKVLAGTFELKNLKRADTNGITLAEAIRNFGGSPEKIKSEKLNPKNLLGYAEVHIEQGPVLEKNNEAVGVVSAISGQSRIRVQFIGRAGHAGTTPMSLRRDALCAAAELILTTENLAQRTSGLVATVGQIQAQPGAGNVIPGDVALTIDVRHADDPIRQKACDTLKEHLSKISQKRRVVTKWQLVHEAPSVICSLKLSALLKSAAAHFQKNIRIIPSGAGHDAAAIAAITSVSMLFVRCKGGISHHPEESVKTNDVAIAVSTMNEFLTQLAKEFSK